MWPNILVGIVGGIAYGVLGLVREKTKEKSQDFSAAKFVKPIIVGACIGGILASQNQVVEFSTIEGFMANSGMYAMIVAVADKVVGMFCSLIHRA